MRSKAAMDVASALQQDKVVHSYLFLRRAMGLIGILLPFALVIGVYVNTGQILSSISGYYYSDMRDVYVGPMCAVGVFLIFYHGTDRTDDLFSCLAGAAAIGVALFPTRPAGNPTDADIVVGYVHIACAGVFFLTLAWFCLRLFRKSSTPLTPRRPAVCSARDAGQNRMSCVGRRQSRYVPRKAIPTRPAITRS
jgi:hypothetical protein